MNAVGEHVPEPSHRAGHHRQSEGQGLNHDVGQPLPVRGGEAEQERLFIEAHQFGPGRAAGEGGRDAAGSGSRPGLIQGRPVDHLEDAAQEVMVACFQPRGVLERADPARSFRGFLYGVVRNLARRAEEKRWDGAVSDFDQFEANNEALSATFDQAWAAALLQQAAALQEERATDERKRRRVELLRMRFQEDLPVREIATLWKQDAAWVHHEYATARDEYQSALREVVRAHSAGDVADIDAECERILAIFD